MAYVMGQATVASNTVALFTIPAGRCNFVFYQTGAGTVYTGTSTVLTSSNGMQCPTIPGVPWEGYPSSPSATFYGTSSGTAVVHYLISTPQQ